MTRIRLTCAAAFATLLFLPACDSTEPDATESGEQELITRVSLHLTGPGGTISASATDPDGDGLGFQVDPLTLAAGVSYAGSIQVLDEVNDADVTDEIREEAEAHQFFFTPGGTDASRLSVTVTDRDANRLPLGLEFTLSVSQGPAATASLNVVLSHFDDGTKNGTTRSADTDIDVTFPITIQ